MLTITATLQIFRWQLNQIFTFYVWNQVIFIFMDFQSNRAKCLCSCLCSIPLITSYRTQSFKYVTMRDEIQPYKLNMKIILHLKYSALFTKRTAIYSDWWEALGICQSYIHKLFHENAYFSFISTHWFDYKCFNSLIGELFPAQNIIFPSSPINLSV